MKNLKPCPFCGGALHIWKQQIKPTIGKVAECEKCGVRISIPWALEEFQAVEFLNRRVESDAEIERLVAEREKMRDQLILNICSHCDSHIAGCEGCPIIKDINEVFNEQ